MKKTPLFLLALSAITFASCTEDEPVSVRQTTNEAISFRSGMGTRATETTNANLDKIFVTAFTSDSTFIEKNRSVNPSEASVYFKDIEYDKGSDSFFTAAAGKGYDWLSENTEMKFYSYSPSMDDLGADITVNGSTPGLNLENFRVADEIADQVDFITAVASGSKKANENTGVELTFDHRLAQIELRAKSESDTYTYKVIGARIGRPETTGSFDFNTNEWTLDSWHDTAVFTSNCDTTTLTADPVSIMGPSGNAMFIPQTLRAWSPQDDPDNVARGAYLSVCVQITRKDNGYVMYPFSDESTVRKNSEFGWASIPLSGTWEQGKKYIYTLDFTNGAGNEDPDDPNPGKPILKPIKFTVKVNDWVDTNTGKVYDMNVPIKQD